MANINLGNYNEKIATNIDGSENEISATIQKMLHLESIESDEQNCASDIKCDYNIYDTSSCNVKSTNLNKNLFADIFKLPIEYIDDKFKHKLPVNVAADLELYKVNDNVETTKTSESFVASPNKEPNEQNKSMYEYLFQPKHIFAKQMANKWGESFTSNVEFLKDSQNVLLNTVFIKNKDTFKEKEPNNNDMSSLNKNEQQTQTTTSEMCNGILDIWKDVKEDRSFLDKYGYMDWSYLLHLNKSSHFLQCISVVNLMSPLTSLILPIIILIFPFLLLKIQGVPIEFQTYMVVLKDIAKNHFIGKMFQLGSLSYDKIIYFLFTIALYFMQIYQNIKYCVSFYKNIQKIHQQLYDVKEFARIVILNMDIFVKYNSEYKTYVPFIKETQIHLEQLKELFVKLENINVRDCQPIFKINRFGTIFKNYYELHSNKDYERALLYAFGFEGYIDNLLGVYEHLSRSSVSRATFSGEGGKEFAKLSIKEQYYPPYVNKKHINNDCKVNNNIIITGVNASGKTTYLKTTTLNILFSQQIGFGFYQQMEIVPYTHIHSYLNIPDTSDRDSLFQAESRRCKEILDVIRCSNDCERHFCIFDELYSGTNPLEASKSAYAFLLYLSRFSNVDFMLTTHYTTICKKLAATTTKNKNGKYKRHIENVQMEVIQSLDKKDTLEYTYKIKGGVCDIQGALQVLRDMDYPPEIIQDYLSYSSAGNASNNARRPRGYRKEKKQP